MGVAFEDYIFEAAGQALRKVPTAEQADVYVVSFFVYDEADDPRAPTLTVGTNTETQVQFACDPPTDFQKPSPWWTPTDAEEARWNYAFWRQDQLAVVADTGLDPIGAALRERWIRDLGLWVEEPVNDDWAEFESMGASITQAFVRMCVTIVQRLHGDGAVSEVFGRPLPVVIHELEYYDAIAAQTEEANPPGLAAGFVAWIAAM